MNYLVLGNKKKNSGFSLIELVVVVAVLAVLSSIAILSFRCFPKRAKATAALTALRQIKTECNLKKAEEEPAIFTSSSLDRYTIQTSGSNSCTGSNGVIRALPDNTNELPTFYLAAATGSLTYEFKGKTGTNFTECLGMICSNTYDENNKYPQEFVMKNSFFSRECSDYVVVDGPKWSDAQANAIKLGGNLVTINDEDESKWIMDKYREIGENLDRDRWGARQLFIGLTRKYETGEKITNRGGFKEGWISGSESSWRPDYWGKRNGGEGGEHDGNSSSIAFGQCGVHEDCWANWNDFPEYRHDAKGLVEIPTCSE